MNRSRIAMVLVGVLKSPRDLRLLCDEHWYRIPMRYAPRKPFTHLAFYQPAAFRAEGKCIRYYAKILERRARLRRELLPREADHPRANEPYAWIRVGRIQTLAHPIRNFVPRRISFGFTTLARLRSAKTVLELYDVAATEAIVSDALRQAGIPSVPQYRIAGNYGATRYILDFAVQCRRGAIAIECDNTRAHRSRSQRMKDRTKDAFLRAHGWRVLRLTEPEILSDLAGCVARIRKTIAALGGL